MGFFIYSAYELGSLRLDYYHNRQVLADVQDIYATHTNRSDTSAEKGEIRKQFKELHKINSDIVGWLTIDKTKINYPILQADNNELMSIIYIEIIKKKTQEPAVFYGLS